MKLRGSRISLVAALVLAACGDDPSVPPAGTHFELVVQGLPSADPDRDGTYEIWVYGARDSAVSAGRFTITNTQEQVVPFDLPVADARRVTVTLEPPNDHDAHPAAFKIMSGELTGATAELRIEGDITNGRPLEPNPDAHSLFTSSNNVQYGYPSLENAGLWLFSILPSQNAHKSREVKVTPLRPSWLYQGWVVWRMGTAEAV